MANEQKKKLNIQIAEDKLTGVYANASSVRVSQNEILLDFGYLIPNTQEPTMKIVSRVNMSHASAEKFVSLLSNALLDYRNKTND